MSSCINANNLGAYPNPVPILH